LEKTCDLRPLKGRRERGKGNQRERERVRRGREKGGVRVGGRLCTCGYAENGKIP